MAVVVIANPRARACRRDPATLDRLRAIVGAAGRVEAPEDLPALADLARRLASAPPRTIAVHGGDGTLHAALSALLPAFAGRPPPLAILPAGTMNVVARSLALETEPERFLVDLVADARVQRPQGMVSRRCLEIDERFGFVFADGVFARFLEEYYAAGGDYGPARAMLLAAHAATSAATGGEFARRLFARYEGRITVDGRDLPWRTYSGVAAATVREVGMGFKLNHRADEDPDRFGVVVVHAPATELLADLPAAYAGYGFPAGRAHDAVAADLAIAYEQPGGAYTIDGDLYRAGSTLRVAIGPPIVFVRPR